MINYDPPASEVSKEVANLTAGKNPHTPVYVEPVYVTSFSAFHTDATVSMNVKHRHIHMLPLYNQIFCNLN